MPTRPTTSPRPAMSPAPPAARPLRTPAALAAAGALGIAGTTALELLTAPYSPVVRAYPLNGAVHWGKVGAALLLAAGFLLLAGRLRERIGRTGAAAMGTVGVATVLGAVPYSLAEALLDSGLTPAAADARLEGVYAEHTWITTAAMIGLPLVLVGVVTLAVVVLRRHALPAWAPVVSLLGIPAAVLAGIAGDAGVPLPHPPAWLFLGLAAYGIALLRQPDRVTGG